MFLKSHYLENPGYPEKMSVLYHTINYAQVLSLIGLVFS